MTPAEGSTAAESTQPCTKCKTEHPVSHFRRTGPGGPWKRCEACRQPPRTGQKRRPSSPEQTRRSNLRRLYGITPEEYDQRRADQDHRCAICLRHEDDITVKLAGRPRLDGQPNAAPVKLHVDHDHHTSAVRGLLCGECNLGIAYFQDEPDRMLRAIAYVSEGGVVP